MGNKQNSGKSVPIVKKPFVTGSPVDEHTLKNSLLFFGSLLLTSLFSFIVCASTGAAGLIIRLLINALIIIVILSVYFNSGTNQGADAVARGEILYQKQESSQTFSQKEKSVSFHKAKGFLVGIFGTLPLLILALIFAFCTSAALTDAGGLPSWMQAYTRKSDIGNALVQYLQPEGMSFVDYLRVIVRVCLIPYVNMIGYSSKEGLLVLERLSPLLIMLPAAAYGTGYLSGRSIRDRIHSVISVNEKKRRKRETRKRMERQRDRSSREPEQLN